MRAAAGLPFVSAAIPAWAFASKEFWDAKPPSEWNAEEIDRMITKSPWAKEASVAYNGGPGGFGGGMGRRGSAGGGIGFPGGGGIGFPGGGGNRGGMGNPGGYPTGGATGPGGGGGSRGGSERQHFEATVRWESALPIQQALHAEASDDKPNPDFAKYYVIGLIGDLPMVGGRRRRSGDNSEGDDDATQTERRLDMYKQYTRLERKDGPLQLEKVEDGSRTGSKGPGTYFYFSRLDDLSMDDKQVSFTTKLGPVEIKAKFVLKDMLYHGKLAV